MTFNYLFNEIFYSVSLSNLWIFNDCFFFNACQFKTIIILCLKMFTPFKSSAHNDIVYIQILNIDRQVIGCTIYTRVDHESSPPQKILILQHHRPQYSLSEIKNKRQRTKVNIIF